ncbi:MOSC domain-containing protein [uncultured Hymenobacter sp.]|uniref:MOSC domain-containing protein n=1 Tax=uncultured Hymenobacter sp. TaxID=170016 RepID=UPI0035CBF0C4
MPTLTDLYVYPIKGLGGFRVTEAEITSRGLRHDRRWLLVDENNRFLTQRKTPDMALLAVAPAHNGFLLTHRRRPELLPLYLPFEASAKRTAFVTIWDDMVWAWRGSKAADEWLSAALSQPVHLVYMSDMVRREVEPDLNPEGQLASFADGYPFLLTSQASLAELNARLAEPVGMDRFRANLVVSEAAAEEEDGWHELQIGGLPFRAVRDCGRCKVTTIDQQTAAISPDQEPLRTLGTYRRRERGIIFGQYVTGPGHGVLRVGDTVTVLSRR